MILRLAVLVFGCVGLFTSTYAQFDPAGGEAGSKGVHWDDARLVQWAASAKTDVGFQQINDTTFGRVDAGTVDDVLGKADRRTLSLGDDGSITLEFDPPISNQRGDDFVVFENGFAWQGGFFLELAFVEVSSDGRNFTRFPSQYGGDTLNQIENLAYMECEWYHNLAGKHQAPYGTPFDLDSLSNTDSLDLNAIRFIRLLDVVGSLVDSLKVRDSRGVPINDPWPTAFANSGFDLDAVGILNNSVSVPNYPLNLLGLPNPIRIGDELPTQVSWYTLSGTLIQTHSTHVPSVPGFYIIRATINQQHITQRICVVD
ncbi:MAG: hypothetical protein H6608_01485 [Flavobacteriales bacterium]|nr:hypothetical protein [Bacteroidota bacterium]MCB9239778.1 hypothetical protein [Flavobacteriales bacterium]